MISSANCLLIIFTMMLSCRVEGDASCESLCVSKNDSPFARRVIHLALLPSARQAAATYEFPVLQAARQSYYFNTLKLFFPDWVFCASQCAQAQAGLAR